MTAPCRQVAGSGNGRRARGQIKAEREVRRGYARRRKTVGCNLNLDTRFAQGANKWRRMKVAQVTLYVRAFHTFSGGREVAKVNFRRWMRFHACVQYPRRQHIGSADEQ